MRTFEEYRNLFPDLHDEVKRIHNESVRPHRGHGFADHNLPVALMAAMIAPDLRTADKAYAAGMLHSIDRWVEKAAFEPTVRRCLKLLSKDYFTSQEMEEILDAVVKHDKKNEDDDSMTLQVLKDADRLINLEPVHIIRAAQWYHEVPAIEIDHLGRLNPASKWGKACNVVDNLRFTLEWIPWLRLPKAKARGEELRVEIEAFIASCERVYHELGLARKDL